LRNIRAFRQNNQSAWGIGWIGIIPTTQCPMRIIIPFGHF